MFTTVLDDSGKPAGSRRGLKLPFGVGFGLHASGILLLLAARAWSVEEAPEPPIRLVYYEAAAPFLGDGGRDDSVRPARARTESPAQSEVAPERLDPQPSADAESAAETRDTRSEAGDGRNDPAAGSGDEKGDGAPGDPNGRPDGRENGRGRGSAADEIFRPGGDVAAPVLVLRVEPVYPEAARKVHAEGFVVIEAVISGSGVVEEARVVKSAHPLLDAAAVRAVEQWRYRAATLNGRSVRVLLTVSVKFSLH